MRSEWRSCKAWTPIVLNVCVYAWACAACGFAEPAGETAQVAQGSLFAQAGETKSVAQHHVLYLNVFVGLGDFLRKSRPEHSEGQSSPRHCAG